MASKSKQNRKCSVCRKPGHTKTDCQSALLASTHETPAPQKKSGSTPVFVRVQKHSSVSAHVVDLRENKDHLRTLPVFREKKASRPERREIDFSALVREANKAPAPKKQPVSSPSFLKPTIKNTPAPTTVTTKPVRQMAPSFLPDTSTSRSENTPVVVEIKQSRAFSFQFFPHRNWNILLVRVVAVLLLLVLPFPAFGYYQQVKQNTSKVVDQTTTGFLSLQASTLAALQANLPQAESDLNTALQSFSGAQAILDKEHKVIQYVAGLLPVIGSEVQSRGYILQAGHHLALGNTYLVQGIQAARQDNQKNLVDKMQTISLHLRSALPQYKEASVLLSRVKVSALPLEHQQSFQDFKVLFAAFINDMEDLVSLSQSIQTVFGGDDFRRYLVLFQNNHELRATGGFVGSMAIIDVQKGKIINVEVPGGGPYDLKGQLGVYLKPPTPILLTNGRFEFQDANWWPHFPASAEKLSKFYEMARGSTIDGVIAINATVFEKVLGVMGPLQNEEHGVTLSSENALSTLQQKVEKDYDKEKNTPKAIIGDVFNDVRSQLSALDASKALQLLSVLHGSLSDKDIQVYMKDASVEKDLRDFGWTGEIITSTSTHDYMMVVQSNLQGQKSDAKIEQTIEHQASIDNDGSVIDTVIIRRKHTGSPGEEFYGSANISYLRVYVPQGAELLDAGGFTYPPEDAFHVSEKWYEEDAEVEGLEKELGTHAKTGTRIYEGFGKTIFGNWVITPAGETSEAYVVYKLPFSVVAKEQFTKPQDWKQKLLGVHLKETSSYQLLAQAQSGVKSQFTSSIIYKDGWVPSWVSTRENMTLAQNGAEFQTILRNQESIALIMEKNESQP